MSLADQATQSATVVDKKTAPSKTVAIVTMLSFGVLSATLYFLLYEYSGDIRRLAEDTHAGDKEFFYIPVVIALIFSFVHGAFTGHFWDVLGIKPKK